MQIGKVNLLYQLLNSLGQLLAKDASEKQGSVWNKDNIEGSENKTNGKKQWKEYWVVINNSCFLQFSISSKNRTKYLYYFHYKITFLLLYPNLSCLLLHKTLRGDKGICCLWTKFSVFALLCLLGFEWYLNKMSSSGVALFSNIHLRTQRLK